MSQIVGTSAMEDEFSLGDLDLSALTVAGKLHDSAASPEPATASLRSCSCCCSVTID